MGKTTISKYKKTNRMYFEKKKDFIYLHDDRYNEITNEDYYYYDFEHAFSLGKNYLIDFFLLILIICNS